MEAAEKRLAVQPCDVILLDLRLPDAYGWKR
jgi:DNA-binding response OmpR family regulator